MSISTPQDNNQEKRANRALLATMAIVLAAVAVIAIIGFVFMNRPDSYIEGQVEGTTIRISGKLAGRVQEFYAHEGDTVHAGDTLVRIHSSVMEAQLGQAEAMREVAAAQNKNRWVTFNVREELLADLTMGKEIRVMVPALGKKEITVKIYYIRDMGSYATWRSTKSTGSYDSRTFQIKARPTE